MYLWTAEEQEVNPYEVGAVDEDGLLSPMDEWEVSPADIIMENFLGEGNFGEVYKGYVNDSAERSQFVSATGPVKVAIKLIKSTFCVVCDTKSACLFCMSILQFHSFSVYILPSTSPPLLRRCSRRTETRFSEGDCNNEEDSRREVPPHC